MILSSLLLVLSGCETISKIDGYFVNSATKYKEPTSGKTAQLRVFYGVGKTIDIFPNASNKNEIRHDPEGGSAFTKRFRTGLTTVEYEPKSLGMPHKPDGTAFGEFKVPANKAIIIAMDYARSDNISSESCPLKYFRVTFEENKNYAVIMKVNSRCSYEFYEYTDTQALKMRNVERL